MKLKPHSIRFKFFSAISLVALMFIGILLLLDGDEGNDAILILILALLFL